MNEIYIKAEDLNRWIIRHLPKNQDLYSIEDLIGAIEDLDGEVEELKDKIEDLEQDIQENYKPISKAKQYE